MPTDLPTPKKKRLPGWAFALVVVLLPPAVYFVVASVGYRYSKQSQSLVATADDRNHVVMASELLDAAKSEVAFDPYEESYRKAKDASGRTVFDYRYPKKPQPLALEMESRIVIGQTPADGDIAVRELKSGVGKGALKKLPELLNLGEGVEAGAVMVGDEQVGQYVLARQAERVFFLRYTGLKLEPRALETLAGRKVAGLSTFKAD